MSKWRCNSCQGVYSDHNPDGSEYYHSCPAELVTHAKCHPETGAVLEAEVVKPFPNRRDERPAHGHEYMDGKWYVRKPHPEERNLHILVPSDFAIVSEGLGRTLVE